MKKGTLWEVEYKVGIEPGAEELCLRDVCTSVVLFSCCFSTCLEMIIKALEPRHPGSVIAIQKVEMIRSVLVEEQR